MKKNCKWIVGLLSMALMVFSFCLLTSNYDAATYTRNNVSGRHVEGDGGYTYQWIYGTALELTGTRGFSEFYSPSVYHSSSVTIGNQTVISSRAAPGTYSKASRVSNYGAVAQKCTYTTY